MSRREIRKKFFNSSFFIYFYTITLLSSLSFCINAVAEEPPLPKGLQGSSELTSEEKPTSEPSLPKGLETISEPTLPKGLEEIQPEEATTPKSTTPIETKEEAKVKKTRKIPFDLQIKGFWDTRIGTRYRDDGAQSKDIILGESRLQIKAEKFWKKSEIEITGDTYGDLVKEEINFDLRQARFTWTLAPRIDLRIGRQILTWGTGNFLFINDLFPKDWNSFFTGREQEYLKAPSDSIKIGYYPEWFNFELVYTPRFTPDRYITGNPVTFWNPLFNELQGDENELKADHPGPRFRDDEWAFRAYRKIGNHELAFYAYTGRWKSPGGQKLIPPLQAYFPKLNVYGASLRSPIGKGIGWIELGYYDSKEDRSGDNPLINNSEFRILLGYEQEIGKDFTGSVQIYLEHMLNYDNYRDTLPFWIHPKDSDRLVTTLQLTKLLLNQNLILSWFMYYSPTDQDAYLRPNVRYKINDSTWIEGGGNIFIGNEPYTFFGQFMDNSNIYVGFRLYF